MLSRNFTLDSSIPLRRKFSRVASSLMYESPMLYGLCSASAQLNAPKASFRINTGPRISVSSNCCSKYSSAASHACSGLTSSVAGKRCSVSERKPLSKWLIGPPE
ncbi:Uncharacterised protein [Shigella sonnei]|nr:Uncharacterised protein [Shigella sonnei]